MTQQGLCGVVLLSRVIFKQTGYEFSTLLARLFCLLGSRLGCNYLPANVSVSFSVCIQTRANIKPYYAASVVLFCGAWLATGVAHPAPGLLAQPKFVIGNTFIHWTL